MGRIDEENVIMMNMIIKNKGGQKIQKKTPHILKFWTALCKSEYHNRKLASIIRFLGPCNNNNNSNKKTVITKSNKHHV